MEFKKIILTEQIKREIASAGLNLEATLSQIEKIAESFANDDKVINYINIRVIAGGRDCFVWLVHRDNNNNYYYFGDKYNRCKAWQITAKKENNILKNIKILIDSSVEIAKKDFLKENKFLSGYKLEIVKNNRPSTLKKYINDDLVTFLSISRKYYHKINTFLMSDDGGIVENTYFNVFNNYNYERARIEADQIIAIYHPDFKKYKEDCEIIAKKREERKTLKKFLKSFNRYEYNDVDFKKINSNFAIYLMNFSYNSLNDARYDDIDGEVVAKINGEEYSIKGSTRREIWDQIVDKSGYFTLFYRDKLQKRADLLRKERQEIKAKKLQEEREKSDKKEYLIIINNYIDDVKKYISDFLNLEKLYNLTAVDTLKKLVEIWHDFQYLTIFERFQNFARWEFKKGEFVNRWEFYKKALSKDVINKIAPRHMYSKKGDLYVMDSIYKNDSFWGKYQQEF